MPHTSECMLSEHESTSARLVTRQSNLSCSPTYFALEERFKSIYTRFCLIFTGLRARRQLCSLTRSGLTEASVLIEVFVLHKCLIFFV